MNKVDKLKAINMTIANTILNEELKLSIMKIPVIKVSKLNPGPIYKFIETKQVDLDAITNMCRYSTRTQVLSLLNCCRKSIRLTGVRNDISRFAR